jgi:hypothetical protein
MNNVKVIITEITPSGYEKRQYDNVVLPFKYGKFLDEQLDYAMFTIERVKKERFPLLSVCSVEITDDEGTEEVCRNWLLVGDESFESPVGSGMYNHDITLIEATKLAEGIPVESLCFTNPSGRTLYTNNAVAPTLDTILVEE